MPARSLNKCVPPSIAIGNANTASHIRGNGRRRRRSSHHTRAPNGMLVYKETIRSDQATLYPMAGDPTNWRRMTGSSVVLQADWISAREYMGFGPKRKNERCGSWWHWKEYTR